MTKLAEGEPEVPRILKKRGRKRKIPLLENLNNANDINPNLINNNESETERGESKSGSGLEDANFRYLKKIKIDDPLFQNKENNNDDEINEDDLDKEQKLELVVDI